jgi:hypothetical protein
MQQPPVWGLWNEVLRRFIRDTATVSPSRAHVKRLTILHSQSSISGRLTLQVQEGVDQYYFPHPARPFGIPQGIKSDGVNISFSLRLSHPQSNPHVALVLRAQSLKCKVWML